MQDEFKYVDLASTVRNGQSAFRKSMQTLKTTIVAEATALVEVPKLQPKYRNQIAISQAKKKDLMDLCKKKVIDEEHHGWYEQLPVMDGVIDKLPLPDVTEDTDNDD